MCLGYCLISVYLCPISLTSDSRSLSPCAWAIASSLSICAPSLSGLIPDPFLHVPGLLSPSLTICAHPRQEKQSLRVTLTVTWREKGASGINLAVWRAHLPMIQSCRRH
ncbi:hypothetical protein PoB_000790000 [Plakobranchus ocellatus]|uniref:Secreted protein n=1 Tax=Plakobranchus ocellatus TaxID=259542 RepID=A0AAV3YEB9_9GAST|nr:hypothetical protein PoB_000790000 [Plakobranchus ocellatus]